MENYNLHYTTQAVHKRAKRWPELQYEVLKNVPIEHDFHLQTFADDESNDMRLRLKIYDYMLDHQYAYTKRRLMTAELSKVIAKVPDKKVITY